MRQYKLDEEGKFVEIKSINPKLKHSETARELQISSSKLQRYRREINLLLPYRKPPSNTPTRKQKSSNRSKNDLKMTTKNFKMK